LFLPEVSAQNLKLNFTYRYRESSTPAPFVRNGSTVSPRKNSPNPGRKLVRGSFTQINGLRSSDFGSVVFKSLSATSSFKLSPNRESKSSRTVSCFPWKLELETNARFNETVASDSDPPDNPMFSSARTAFNGRHPARMQMRPQIGKNPFQVAHQFRFQPLFAALSRRVVCCAGIEYQLNSN
jgi:hypothetical protein